MPRALDRLLPIPDSVIDEATERSFSDPGNSPKQNAMSLKTKLDLDTQYEDRPKNKTLTQKLLKFRLADAKKSIKKKYRKVKQRMKLSKQNNLSLSPDTAGKKKRTTKRRRRKN